MFWIHGPLEEARYEKALDRCARLMRWRPDAGVRALRGTVLLLADRVGEAETELRNSLDGLRDRQQAEALWALGSALAAQGKRGEAVRMYQGAMDADPRYLTAHADLAALELDCGNFDTAHQIMAQAFDIASNSRRRRSSLDMAYLQSAWARVLAGMKRFAEATATLERATRETARVRSKPDRAGAWWRIGQAHLALKNSGEALVAFENAIQVDPDGYYGHLAERAIRDRVGA